MSDSEEDQPTMIKTSVSEDGVERSGSIKRRKPGLKGLALKMGKLKTFSNVTSLASEAAKANSHEGNLSRSSNMAMVRSPRISLNSIGEDKRSRNSLNLSVSSIKDLMMSASPDDGLGDDDVFDTNQENTVTKALGALGKAPEGKSVTDAAMRAMFAKKAARTIHGSLKQRAKNRVIYARKAGEGEFGATVEDGEKISMEMACSLKHYAWGSANMPPKSEWLKQGICLHPPEGLFSYGVRAPRNNGVKNFMVVLNAYFLKHLLFDHGKKVGRGGANNSRNRGRFTRSHAAAQQRDNSLKGKSGSFKSRHRRFRDIKGSEGSAPVVSQSWGSLLKPNEKSQTEMLSGGLAEILCRLAEGGEAVFCLPGPANCFEPAAHYGIDGVTEKLRLFKTKKEDELKKLLGRYFSVITADNGTGLLCVLYSLMMSRGFDKLKSDMQDQANNSLVDPMGDCSQCLLNLIVFGMATPYLHNGVLEIEDEESSEVKERTGCINRNDIGFLLWDRDESRTARWQLGSRLKTPTLPMWVTKVNGSYGVLFNPNKELMRSYAAENRFQLYYFSDAEFKKEERKDTVLTIDTRNTKTRTLNETNNFDDADLEDGIQEPPLQLAIKTKWDDADIDWHGVHPYV